MSAEFPSATLSQSASDLDLRRTLASLCAARVITTANRTSPQAPNQQDELAGSGYLEQPTIIASFRPGSTLVTAWSPVLAILFIYCSLPESDEDLPELGRHLGFLLATLVTNSDSRPVGVVWCGDALQSNLVEHVLPHLSSIRESMKASTGNLLPAWRASDGLAVPKDDPSGGPSNKLNRAFSIMWFSSSSSGMLQQVAGRSFAFAAQKLDKLVKSVNLEKSVETRSKTADQYYSSHLNSLKQYRDAKGLHIRGDHFASPQNMFSVKDIKPCAKIFASDTTISGYVELDTTNPWIYTNMTIAVEGGRIEQIDLSVQLSHLSEASASYRLNFSKNMGVVDLQIWKKYIVAFQEASLVDIWGKRVELEREIIYPDLKTSRRLETARLIKNALVSASVQATANVNNMVSHKDFHTNITTSKAKIEDPDSVVMETAKHIDAMLVRVPVEIFMCYAKTASDRVLEVWREDSHFVPEQVCNGDLRAQQQFVSCVGDEYFDESVPREKRELATADWIKRYHQSSKQSSKIKPLLSYAGLASFTETLKSYRVRVEMAVKERATALKEAGANTGAKELAKKAYSASMDTALGNMRSSLIFYHAALYSSICVESDWLFSPRQLAHNVFTTLVALGSASVVLGTALLFPPAGLVVASALGATVVSAGVGAGIGYHRYMHADLPISLQVYFAMLQSICVVLDLKVNDEHEAEIAIRDHIIPKGEEGTADIASRMAQSTLLQSAHKTPGPFFKTWISIVGGLGALRRLTDSQLCIGVIGFSRAGKSTLIENIWGVDANAGGFDDHRTLEIAVHRPKNESCLVLDFPGINEDSSLAGVSAYAKDMVHALVILVPYDRIDATKVKSQLEKLAASFLRPHVAADKGKFPPTGIPFVVLLNSFDSPAQSKFKQIKKRNRNLPTQEQQERIALELDKEMQQDLKTRSAGAIKALKQGLRGGLNGSDGLSSGVHVQMSTSGKEQGMAEAGKSSDLIYAAKTPLEDLVKITCIEAFDLMPEVKDHLDRLSDQVWTAAKFKSEWWLPICLSAGIASSK